MGEQAGAFADQVKVISLHWYDVAVIVAFFAIVYAVSLYKSRREKTSDDYFLAGRGATWPFIGFSLIAANISTEHFVGMAGQSAGISGLAISSFEWVAAITLVAVAWYFLPRFLSAGIYTIPEFLEYRYNVATRMIMSFFMLVMLVFVTTVSVVYSAGVALQTFFGESLAAQGWSDWQILQAGIWVTGVAAVIYTAFGGLKAVLWADLFQGSALILGGAVVLYFTLHAIGGWDAAMAHPYIAERMHVVKAGSHPVVPWTIFMLGIWIPNFYYWGLNQFITQRALAARTLRQGQLGVLFAAFLKLLIPFIIVVPGLMAPVLFPQDLPNPSGTALALDHAYPTLVRNLVPPGWMGLFLAALAGAVVSSIASMLNSASTIFTMDVYRRLLHRDAPQQKLVRLGRALTVVFVLIACLMTMIPNLFQGGVFTFIQEFQGMFTPGILAVFVFGFVFQRAPAAAAITGMIACPISYALLTWPTAWVGLTLLSEMPYLNRMAIAFVVSLLSMAVVTVMAPLQKPAVIPRNESFDMRPSRSVVWLGVLCILLTVALYVSFR
jgi:SSS family solute:Na+ symporter